MEAIEKKESQPTENTGDDYSLDRVPRDKRNMGWLSITNITFGIATAIFYFQMGSVMALQFGAINAIISAVYAIIHCCWDIRDIHCLSFCKIRDEC